VRTKTLTIPDPLLEGIQALVKRKGVMIIIENEKELEKLGVDVKKARRVLEQWLLAELAAQVLNIKEDDIDEQKRRSFKL